jgi:hypothetical protein
LAALLAPFEASVDVEFVGGVYRIDPRSLFEEVVGLATMPGQLTPVDEGRFKPSARSMAFKRGLAMRVGGFPDWLYTAEDTLFDVKLAESGAPYRLARDAVVHWRPRRSLGGVVKQFYLYGRGGGHVPLDPSGTRYNLRNLLLIAVSCVSAVLVPAFWVLVAGLVLYFFVFAFHGKAYRVAGTVGRPVAYLLCVVVLGIVLVSDAVGFCVGSMERLLRPKVYRERLRRYLSSTPTPLLKGGVQ